MSDANDVDCRVKCQHPEVTITEYYNESSIERWRANDGSWQNNHEPGGLSGKVHVECSDCNLSKTFTSSNTPKWVKRIQDEAINFLPVI